MRPWPRHRVCGIIHTDLKPENVLVGCPRGVPVNKQGIPLVGNVDPVMAAAKRDGRVQKEEKKPSGKKKDKDKKYDDEEGSCRRATSIRASTCASHTGFHHLLVQVTVTMRLKRSHARRLS